MKNIPFVSFGPMHSEIREELDKAYSRVMDKNIFIQGGPICSAVIMITIVVVKYFGSLFYFYFFSAEDVETEVAVAPTNNHLSDYT